MIAASLPLPQIGFSVLPWRWIAERTFAWLGNYRRLARDYEISPRTSEAWINLRTFISDSVFWLAKIVQKSIEEFAILIRMKPLGQVHSPSLPHHEERPQISSVRSMMDYIQPEGQSDSSS
jgi:hypothetical protein